MSLKHVNTLISGNHPFMSLFASSLATDERKIVIHKDDLNLWNEQYIEHIGALERALLKTWGMDFDIDALKNIEEFITESEVTLVIGDTHLNLGHSPSSNLAEIYRKFSGLFSYNISEQIENIFTNEKLQNVFNERFESLSTRIGLNCFRYRNLETLTLAIFETHCPENVRLLFHDFFQNINKPEHRNFLFATRSYFHESMSLQLGELEAIHLFLSLLSPLYNIDIKALDSELKKFLVIKKVEFLKNKSDLVFNIKKNKISQFHFNESNAQYTSQNYILFGAEPFKERFLFEQSGKSFRSIELIIKINNNFSRNKTLFVSRFEKMGTSIPLYHIKSLSEDSLNIRIFVANEDGLDDVKIKARVAKYIIMELRSFGYQCRPDDIISINLGYHYLSLEWGKIHIRKQASRQPLNNYISYIKDNGSSSTLKNVYGFGPLRQEPLGSFSLLMQLKNTDVFMQN